MAELLTKLFEDSPVDIGQLHGTDIVAVQVDLSAQGIVVDTADVALPLKDVGHLVAVTGDLGQLGKSFPPP